MVSMFFCFISAMPELAVSRVNLARAWTYASLSNCNKKIKPVSVRNTAGYSNYSPSSDSSTCMEKIHAILMAQRIPSRHREATSVSSQSCRPTLKAARKGVHAS